MWFAASALIAVNREIQGNRSLIRASGGCRTALNTLEIKGWSAWGSGNSRDRNREVLVVEQGRPSQEQGTLVTFRLWEALYAA